MAFSKFQGPLFQPIRAPYLSEDPQKPRLPSSTLNSGPNRSKLKYVLRGTLNRTLSDSYVVRPCRCRVVRRRRAPSVRKVIFQGSYRYRPVTQLLHTKNALIYPSDVSAYSQLLTRNFFVAAPPPSSSRHLEYLEYLYLNFYINPLLIKVHLLFNIYYNSHHFYFKYKNYKYLKKSKSWN